MPSTSRPKLKFRQVNNWAFFDAGWTKGNLVDVMVVIGDKTVSNYLHGTTRIPVDFPPAPALSA